MDFVEINIFTQEKKVKVSRDALYNGDIDRVDALRLILYATKRMYGLKASANILHTFGVDKIDLSI